ncbi:MAG TPA: hypothetical protein VN285_01225 [Candidatus Deferrimicrobium sp.]|nr:hypothetical protein [Candidatus Deferrimicrobium sp.]
MRRLNKAAVLSARILVCILVASLISEAAGISVSQSVDRFTLPFEDSLHFEVVLSWDGPQTAYFFPKPLEPVFDGLKVRGFASSISSTGSGSAESTTKRFRFSLIPTASGTARIAPVTVQYLSWPDSLPGELVTETMTIQIAERVTRVQGSVKVTYWLLGAVAVLVLAGGAALVIKRSVRRRSTPIVKTPAEEATERLTILKREAGSDLKKFQTGLYELLAVFLKAKFNIDPDRLTDEEIDDALATTDLSAEQKAHMSRWLMEARRDKFRPVAAAPGDTIRLETEVRRYFEKL